VPDEAQQTPAQQQQQQDPEQQQQHEDPQPAAEPPQQGEGQEGAQKLVKKKKKNTLLSQERLRRLKEQHDKRGIIYISRCGPSPSRFGSCVPSRHLVGCLWSRGGACAAAQQHAWDHEQLPSSTPVALAAAVGL
jgi:hypothetical protein